MNILKPVVFQTKCQKMLVVHKRVDIRFISVSMRAHKKCKRLKNHLKSIDNRLCDDIDGARSVRETKALNDSVECHLPLQDKSSDSPTDQVGVILF